MTLDLTRMLFLFQTGRKVLPQRRAACGVKRAAQVIPNSRWFCAATPTTSPPNADECVTNVLAFIKEARQKT